MTWAAAEIAASRAAAHAEALADAHDALAAANDKIRELERKAVADAHQSALISWDQQQRIAELHQDLAAEGGNEQQRRITQLEEEAESLRDANGAARHGPGCGRRRHEHGQRVGQQLARLLSEPDASPLRVVAEVTRGGYLRYPSYGSAASLFSSSRTRVDTL